MILYLLTGWCIGSGVNSICAEGKSEYYIDNVDALLAYGNSEDHTLKEKSRAIWAFGQLGDKRALPVLENLYIEQPCDHDKY